MTNINNAVNSATTNVTDNNDEVHMNNKVTSAELLKAMNEARQGYLSAREHTARTAATVYYVWYHCVSPSATTEMQAWYKTQIDERAQHITAHNENIEADKALINKQEKADIKELAQKQEQANDPDTKVEFGEAIEAKKAAAKDARQKLIAKRMVSIVPREGAAEHTQIVRYVLELHNEREGSMVNRFAKVVAWLQRTLSNTVPTDIAAVAEKIVNAGGFEDVCDKQRIYEAGLPTDQASTEPVTKNEDDASSKVLITYFQKALTTAKTMANVQLDEQLQAGRFVTLIGRVADGGISIVGGAPVTEAQALEICCHYDERKLLPANDAVEFLATAMALGDLVPNTTGETKPDDKAVIRHTCVVSNDNEGRLLIAPSNTTAAVVVNATPKSADVTALLTQPGYWRMHQDGVKKLGDALKNPVTRRLATLTVNDKSDDVGEQLLHSPWAWTARNNLVDTEDQLRWLPLESENKDKPLDIDGFKPVVTATVSRAQILNMEGKNVWRHGKPEKNTENNAPHDKPGKGARASTITFTATSITATANSGQDEMACISTTKAVVTISVAAATFRDLIKQLHRQAADEYMFKADPQGALSVSFETQHGHYEIYLPTWKEKGGLETRRFVPLQIHKAA